MLVWMDFRSSFSWLMGKNKLIFGVKNFLGSGYFLTFFSNLMDHKKGGVKKGVKTKNQFFHAHQPRKGIFEIHSHRSCNFVTFFLELLMAASIPGVEIFSWKSACVVFFNMQNLNFRGAPESERTGFALTVTVGNCTCWIGVAIDSYVVRVWFSFQSMNCPYRK